MDIPIALLNQIQEGNCVLFLGSGANYGSVNISNDKIPLGPSLGTEIAKRFLSDAFANSPLALVSELAISETNLFTVQKFVAQLFNDFKPCEYHKVIPSFVWKAIFTTNYDTIIEQSYNNSTNSVQDLVPIFKNMDQDKIFINKKSLPYYKLHGCINNINDEHTPLILTAEQYISHRKNRENLFDTLKELAYSHPFLFIGYSMADMNIRTILSELGASLDIKPRSYIISPNIKGEEVRLWDSKKITPIAISFENFLEYIDNNISKTNRILSSFRPQLDHPIFSKFVVDPSKLQPTENFIQFINQEIDFVHSNIPTGNTNAQAFYKGYFENWDAIVSNLDVIRALTNTIISEVLFEDRYNDDTSTFLFLIQGQAGSGKSVLLKRLAWNSAVEFGKFAIYLKPGSKLHFELFAELYNYTRERIYLFIDGVAGREDSYKTFIERCRKEKMPITLIVTERTNVWNTDCKEVQNYLTLSYSLRYLNDKEIISLLSLLEKHNSLGLLANQSYEDRIKALSEQAGRELLVALYEATWGIPFEDIIYDEYEKINSEDAKMMYLTVCILHRLGAAARAGLIARVHEINFSEFKRRLFQPLEFIVFVKEDYRINDNVYLTRHKQIADIVFTRVLHSQQDKYDAYVRVLTYLNTDFESDKIACLAMTNARKLKEIFSDPKMVRNLFDIADKNSPNNSKVLQQRAIYEMIVPGGSLFSAEKFLKRAKSIAPDDNLVMHSFAELAFKKAEETSYRIEQNQFLEESISICSKILKKSKDSLAPLHTILKVYLFKLEKELKNEGVTTIDNIVKEFEKYLNQAKQYHIDDDKIIGIEVSFNELFSDIPAAKDLLDRSYQINKSSPYIALRYAAILRNEGSLDKAINVLQETLKLTPNNQDVNLKYGILLSEKDDANYDLVKQYLRRSFTKGDTRYTSHFWYARTLYLNNDIPESRAIFNQLEEAKIAYNIRNEVKGIVKKSGTPITFFGAVVKVEESFGFITRESQGDRIFFRPSENGVNYSNYVFNGRVKFELGFTFKGPVAINVTYKSNGG